MRIALQQEIDALEDEDGARTSDLVRLVITRGIAHGASDIHLEPMPDALAVKLRIDGVLQEVARIRGAVRANVIARVKVLADLLTYRTDIPQEGRIEGHTFDPAPPKPREGRDEPNFRPDGHSRRETEATRSGVDLRVSTFPTIHGEKAVIRIFDPAKRTFQMDDLGFPREVRAELERFLVRPQGVILLTGPAGSGKTTTIYASLHLLSERAGGTRNIVSIEDPVEYAVPGVTQTQINLPAGLTFSRSLRSLLRQDPEVIMVGEIRDAETAKIAIEAGLTGHLVMSTVHTGSACGVFGRLLDMGVEPFLVSSAVTAVLAQRLVRMVCPKCRQPVTQDPGFQGLKERCGARAFQGTGCDSCLNTGYSGRTVLAEFLAVNEEMRQAILRKSDHAALENIAASAGMKPLLEQGIELVRQGATSPAELRRVMVVE